MGMIDPGYLDTLKRKAFAAENQAQDALPLLPGESPPVDPAMEWEGILTMAVTMASTMWPYLPSIYTPDAIRQLAAALVPVADKYGLSLDGLTASPELALALVVLPLGVSHVLIHRQWKAAQVGEAAATNVTNEQATPQAPVRSNLGDNFEDHGGRLSVVTAGG